MKKRLGVIGGGQLGMMITEAAKNLSEHISEIIVLDPTENCPAAQAGAKQIVGDFKDELAILKLADKRRPFLAELACTFPQIHPVLKYCT